MDILTIALVFLIILISFFLGFAGWVVILILLDLKKALRKLNEVLYNDSAATEKIRANIKSKSAGPRFFKKSL